MNGCSTLDIETDAPDVAGTNQNPMLETWDHVIISISGGKDSCVLMDWAVQTFPKSILTCVHAVIDIDWDETLPIVREQARFYDLPLVEVQAVRKDGSNNGFLKQLTAPRVNRETGEVGQYKFPDMGNRWCTSMLKCAPIDKYVRKLKGNILVLIGERREESTQRSKLMPYRPDEKNSINGRRVVKFSPILDYREEQVWAIINYRKIPTHPCYSWGVSRASCAICIFSSEREIKIAHERAPKIVERYMDAEAKIDHSFRYKPATKNRQAIRTTIADILGVSRQAA